MELDSITPLILTYNEAPNIDRTLKQLTWAKRIVVVDSYSTDETLEVLNHYPQVEVFQRCFDTHANQWNFGVAQVRTEWVLSLDADYFITDNLLNEIKLLLPAQNIDAYFVNFKYCVFGKPLRGTILPPRQVLFRKEKSVYVDDGHTQRLRVSGNSGQLKGWIYHDDRKSFNRWLWAQDRYMAIEAKKLLEMPNSELSLSDKIRKQKILAPFIILIYCLFLKGGILDGWHGWYYAFQRMFAELLLSLRLIEEDWKMKSRL